MKNIAQPTFGGRISIKSSSNVSGFLFTYVIKTNDGNGKLIHENISCLLYNPMEDKIIDVDPKIIWELEDIDNVNLHHQDLEKVKSKMEVHALGKREASFAKIKAERLKEIVLRKKYSEEYFNKKMEESNKRLKEYKSKALLNVNMDIAIRGEEVRLKEFEYQFEQIKAKMAKEGLLLAGAPELISVCVIIQKDKKEMPTRISTEDENKKAIEMAGMVVVMDYEKKKERTPEDVSLKFLGYDIKSTSKDELRYIEVKSFAESGIIELTQNEWIMADKLKEKFWIYVVENVKTKFILSLIRNPCAKFKKYEIVPTEIRIKVADWKDYVEETVR